MRDERIDVLRFIGLSMIMLAHTAPPSIIFQLRNFDVPLMVFLAGISFSLSYNSGRYLVYVWKRIKRLVLPVWSFLSLYFLFMYLTNVPQSVPEIKTVLSSYFLISGIGYVWIIRVFLLVAIIAPFLYRFNGMVKSHFNYFLLLFILYSSYSVLMFLSPQVHLVQWVLNNVIFYVIPYSIVFSLGVRVNSFSVSQINTLICLMGVLFLTSALAVYFNAGRVMSTQDFKYPPQAYYLSYSLFVAFLGWRLSGLLLARFHFSFLRSWVMFVSQNSIWVYLWHIPFVAGIPAPYYIKWPVVLFVSSGITYVQVYFVNFILIPKLSSVRVKTNLKLVFTG